MITLILLQRAFCATAWKLWQTIKQHRDSKTLLMGVSWYRPEQWDRLREISEDKKHFAHGSPKFGGKSQIALSSGDE